MLQICHSKTHCRIEDLIHIPHSLYVFLCVWESRHRKNARVLNNFTIFILHSNETVTMQEKINNQPMSSPWIRFIGHAQNTKALTLARTVFHPVIHHTRPHLLIWNRLWLRYKSMYQSSESRWDRNPLTELWSQSVAEKPHGGGFYLGFKNTVPWHNGGQLWKGRQRRLHLRLCMPLCGRRWWCSAKNTWGQIQSRNADWQRLACGWG